jgi:hypothetical protein
MKYDTFDKMMMMMMKIISHVDFKTKQRENAERKSREMMKIKILITKCERVFDDLFISVKATTFETVVCFSNDSFQTKIFELFIITA